MGIYKIAITGGPCGGKSTALGEIQKYFTQKGFHVLIIEETATELIPNGMPPHLFPSQKDYQRCQLKLQLEKEKIFAQAAELIGSENTLIVCDRGGMDNRAYLTEDDFHYILDDVERTEEELLASYDAVFHLVTAAKGAEEFYTTANNPARTETPKEAADLDDRILLAWEKHPYVKVIDNRGDFEDKIQRLLQEITDYIAFSKKVAK